MEENGAKPNWGCGASIVAWRTRFGIGGHEFDSGDWFLKVTGNLGFFCPYVCSFKCDFQILQKGFFVDQFVLSRNLDCVAQRQVLLIKIWDIINEKYTNLVFHL